MLCSVYKCHPILFQGIYGNSYNTHSRVKQAFSATEFCVTFDNLQHVNDVIAILHPQTSIVVRSALHRLRCTAAIMPSTLIGACNFDGRHIFTYDTGVRFLSHREAVLFFETRQRLDEVKQDNIARIPVQKYQLDHSWQYSLCVYFMGIRSQPSPTLHRVSWVHLTL